MKGRVIFAVLFALALVLESKVRVMGAGPNLTILFAYYSGLKYGQEKGLAVGALTGLLTDSLSGGILGPGILGKATAGYLAAFLRGGLFIWTPLLGFLAAAALTMADGYISFASISVFSISPNTMANASLIILCQAAANSLVGPFIRPGAVDQ